MTGTHYARAGGTLALAGAALWAIFWVGATVLASRQAPAHTTLLAALGLCGPLVVAPAVGGVWLRQHDRRRQTGAGLVAAAGLVVTATLPAVLARAFALDTGWQLLALAGVLLLACAGGCATASLLRSTTVRWAPTWHGITHSTARALLLAATFVVAITTQPPLYTITATALRQGVQAGAQELAALPAGMLGLTLVGFAAVALTGLAAAAVRPPCVGAAAAAVLAAYATLGVVHLADADAATAALWLPTAAIAALAVAGTTMTTVAPVRVHGIPRVQPVPPLPPPAPPPDQSRRYAASGLVHPSWSARRAATPVGHRATHR